MKEQFNMRSKVTENELYIDNHSEIFDVLEKMQNNDYDGTSYACLA